MDVVTVSSTTTTNPCFWDNLYRRSKSGDRRRGFPGNSVYRASIMRPLSKSFSRASRFSFVPLPYRLQSMLWILLRTLNVSTYKNLEILLIL